MNYPLRFEVELTLFVPQLQKEQKVFENVQSLRQWLSLPEKSDLVLYIAALGTGIDHGNFILFINANGQAFIQLHEHREHTPIEPGSEDNGAVVIFLDESGEAFEVPAAHSLTRARAIEALVFWLPEQWHLPSLDWL